MKAKNQILILALLCTAIMYSCKKEGKTVPVQFYLTDKPGLYDSVNVHIIGIEANILHDSTAWISIDAKDTVINLLDLQNGITQLIAQDMVPEGILQEVRFILGDGNTVVVNGISYPLETPSAMTSGLKIKVNKRLNETFNAFILDFDAAQSVSVENGIYRLDPVIRLTP
jgi:hypothetical protein